MRRLAALALAACAMDCTKAPPREEPLKVGPYIQQMHPGSLAAGAVVVERSGELNLVNSAVAAIDGSAAVAWWSPQRNHEQWLTLRLPAETRLDAVDVVRHEVKETATAVRLEASMTGEAWTELGVLEPKPGELVARLPLKGETARLLRVTMLEGPGVETFIALPELVVDGELIGQREDVSWDGAWRVNQRPLSLRSESGMVYGEVPFERTTMKLVGRPRNGFLPFAWTQGNVVGYGALALSPEGEMSGLWYWEFPFTWRVAESWFGRREAPSAAPVVDRRNLALDFLREGHPSPFYELALEGGGPLESVAAKEALALIRDIAVDNPTERFRLSVWDFDDQDSAEQRLASLQRAFSSPGSLPPNMTFAVKAGNLLDQPPGNPVTRAIFDRVDLEVAPRQSGDASPMVLR